MKMKQAYEIVHRMYGRGDRGTVGWLKRNRREPLFVVGFTSIDGIHGAKAHSMGSSNVDWESAFANATEDNPAERARLIDIMEEVL